jgi:hypothetical protein
VTARAWRMGNHFRVTDACLGKTKWRDEKAAQRAITRIRAANPHAIDSTVRPYRCSACKKWHVGHGY